MLCFEFKKVKLEEILNAITLRISNFSITG